MVGEPRHLDGPGVFDTFALSVPRSRYPRRVQRHRTPQSRAAPHLEKKRQSRCPLLVPSTVD